MPIRPYRPTTPGRRIATPPSRGEVTKEKPERSLLSILPAHAGRNAQGKITVRHRGQRHKRFYRLVDFLQNRYDLPAKVLAIEYDPNRNARIALVGFPDGEKRYILAPAGMTVNAEIVSSPSGAPVRLGNRMPLRTIPIGVGVHNVELIPGRGGVLVRAAGGVASLIALEGNMAQLRLGSGEVRRIPADAMASVGQVSNVDAANVRLGKAGRMRWRGVRPTVRGKAMNPVDHPHGGGEGNQPIGLRQPKTPWGRPALGVRTRRKHLESNRFIVSRRRP